MSAHRHRHRRPAVAAAPAILLGVIAGLEIGIHANLGRHGVTVNLPAYGYGVLAFLGLKLGLACLHPAASADPVPDCVVGGVITIHNEDPAVFSRCLNSLLAQTRPPDYLTVVDDGSSKRTACLSPKPVRTRSAPGASPTG
jgi:hypothetical protein